MIFLKKLLTSFSVFLLICATSLAVEDSSSLPKVVGKVDAPFDSAQPYTSQPSGLPFSDRLHVVPAPFDNAQRVWTLPELIDEAVKRNPLTTESWQQANAAAANVTLAKSAYYPTLTIGANGAASHITNPLYPGTEEVNQLAAGPQLQINYLIFDFGARKAGVEAARFNLLSSNFTFNQTLQSVILSTMTAYYNLDGAKAAVENAEASLNLAESSLKVAQIREQVGLGTSTDMAQALQNVEQDRFNLENARGTLATTKSQLATTLGLPAQTNFEVAPPSNPPSLKILEQKMDQLIDLAFRQRPDLAVKYNTWRSKLASADQAEANRWPVLTSNVDLERDYYTGNGKFFGGSVNASGNYDTATAGLTFSFDLFDGGNKSSQALSAKKLADAAKADLLSSELGAISDVVVNFIAFKTAAKKVDAAQALLDASQKSFDSVQISYKNGLKTIIDLLTAQSNLASARNTFSQTRTDLFVSSVNLSNATGSILPSYSGGSAFNSYTQNH